MGGVEEKKMNWDRYSNMEEGFFEVVGVLEKLIW
jgi:hypothetical protein